jgi:hypothetical protein
MNETPDLQYLTNLEEFLEDYHRLYIEMLQIEEEMKDCVLVDEDGFELTPLTSI